MKPMKPALGRTVHYLLTEEQQKQLKETSERGGLPTFGSEGEERKEAEAAEPQKKAMAFIIGPEEIAPSEETPVTLLVMCSNGMPFRVENAVQGTEPGNWCEPVRV